MKKNLVVLVLLVTWSLLSISPLTSSAYAGSTDGPSRDDNIVEVNGSSDDDTGGDPGDAGDGYGIADPDDLTGGLGGCDGMDESILDEYLLIMLSLIQLAL